MAALVIDPGAFQRSDDFAASLGLVPPQDGTGARYGGTRSASSATAICAGCWSAARPR